MKVVVTGGGAVGRHLSQDLTERGHDVTLVEQRRELAEKLDAWAPDTRIVYGDACEPAHPRASRRPVGRRRGRRHRRRRGQPRDVAAGEAGVRCPACARSRQPPKNEWLLDRASGVWTRRSHHPHILTAMVEEAVTVGDLVRLLRLEGGKVALVEMRLPDQSPTSARPSTSCACPPTPRSSRSCARDT